VRLSRRHPELVAAHDSFSFFATGRLRRPRCGFGPGEIPSLLLIVLTSPPKIRGGWGVMNRGTKIHHS
jgi:hypothetical protein